jgi:hypothetical protein
MANKRYVDPMLKGAKLRNGLPEDVIIKSYEGILPAVYGNYPDDISSITKQMNADTKTKRKSSQKY